MTTRLSQPSRHQPSALAVEPALEAVFDSLTFGVVLFDRELRPLLRNDAARDLLPDDTDLAHVLAALTVDSRYEDWARNLRDTLESRVPRRFDGLLSREAGRSDRYLNVVCSALRESAGPASARGLLLVEDVTARISMERRLAVSERLAAVGKLCASVAHELNNPLDGILRYINLALRLAEGGGDDKIAEYLRDARAGTMRMVDLVRALLEFSRGAPPSLADGNVNQVIEEAVRTMQPRAAEHRVALLCHFQQPDMPTIRGSNLFQVFCNLIKNALDVMPDGGSLAIVTRLDGTDVEITFKDTGPGLPDVPEKLFEPFYTTKPAGEGTGLGLAVCREMVEKYGGRITAANRTDAPGAVFTVRIPAGVADEPFVSSFRRRPGVPDAQCP